MRCARSLPVLLGAVLLAACSGGGGGNRAEPPPSATTTAGVPTAAQTVGATPAPGARPGEASATPATVSPATSTPAATPATAAPRAGASPTPAPPGTALYRALLSAPFPAEELPAGYAEPAVTAATFFINDLARANGVVGEVDVSVRGPDASDAIVYLIFPEAAAAKAVFDAQAPAAPYTNASSVDVPDAGFPLRCNSFAGNGPSGYLAGVTLCNGLVGEVEVAGFSQVLYDAGAQPSGGNMAAALALVRAGAAHLAAVRRTP